MIFMIFFTLIFHIMYDFPKGNALFIMKTLNGVRGNVIMFWRDAHCAFGQNVRSKSR